MNIEQLIAQQREKIKIERALRVWEGERMRKKQKKVKRTKKKKSKLSKKAKDKFLLEIEQNIEHNPLRAKQLAVWLIKELKKQKSIDEDTLIKTYELLIHSKRKMITQE